MSEPLPPSKTGRQENFPVASFLIRSDLRPLVGIYYAFARAADDVADHPGLSPAEKIKRLADFRAALTAKNQEPRPNAPIEAVRLGRILAQRNIPIERGGDLLVAFKRDATQSRYKNWDELVDYCRYSAVPVGRFLIDLHGESRDAYPACDALCTALQIINHLQDCGDDYRLLDRVYLPDDWMRQYGAEITDLKRAQASPELRRVLLCTVNAVAELMPQAVMLPGFLRHRRIAMEASVVCHVARQLIALLRRLDPLATRACLGRARYLSCFIGGMIDGWRRRTPRWK